MDFISLPKIVFFCFLIFLSIESSTPFRINRSHVSKSLSFAPNTLTEIVNGRRRNLFDHHAISGKKLETVLAEVDKSPKTPKSSNFNPKVIVSIIALIVAAAAAINGFSAADLDLSALLEKSVVKIGSLGPIGYLYFALIYILAEVLCVPAVPLAASSGYLFGLIPGFLTVLCSATLAACISFFIGRLLLREWAQKIANGSDKWRAIDSAIGKEGFKVILILRITPIFPFSIVNYLYGLTSVNFWSYLSATLLGFAPGTLAIVYAGTAGKAFLSKGFGDVPWYVYVAGGGVALLIGSLATKFAADAMKKIESSPEPSSGPNMVAISNKVNPKEAE